MTMKKLQFVLPVLLFLGAATLAQGPVPSCDHARSAAPLFHETFSSGSLDKTKWFIDTGKAPGNIAGVNTGTLSAEHVDLSTGMLRLKLTQSVSGGLATSTGAEIRSKQLFGYGTYVWVARAASTSDTPRGAGAAVSISFDARNDQLFNDFSQPEQLCRGSRR
jgi:hypothetical protein